MSDPVDRADVEIDNFIASAIEVARKPVPGLAYIGKCWNCAEPLAEPYRFCDEDCRDDYEHIQERKRINRK